MTVLEEDVKMAKGDQIKENPHLVDDPARDGRKTFKSDKYQWCPTGFVPLKVTDPMAVDLLFIYALRRGVVDREFEEALRAVIAEGAASPPQSEGVLRILVERFGQVNREGWTAEHDDRHRTGDLARAAATYARASLLPHPISDAVREALIRTEWPAWDEVWFKPKSPIRDLERAGALIAAEIDRRLRAGEKE